MKLSYNFKIYVIFIVAAHVPTLIASRIDFLNFVEKGVLPISIIGNTVMIEIISLQLNGMLEFTFWTPIVMASPIHNDNSAFKVIDCFL